MKKLNLFLLSALGYGGLLCGCTDEVQISVNETRDSDNVPQVSLMRPEAEAIEIATQAIALLEDNTHPYNRSLSTRVIDKNNKVEIIGSGNYKSRAGVSDTLLYVVNYADSMGFAIVSASRNTQELLAVTEAGSYNASIPVDNPGFNWFIEMAKDYVASSFLPSDGIANPLADHITIGDKIVMPEDRIETDTIWHAKVANRVNLYWGQEGVEGRECPNNKTGCSIVALGMALSYFCYPTTLELTYKKSNYADKTPVIALDWAKIKKHNARKTLGELSVFSESGCEGESTHEIISQMLRELGHRAGTVYHSPELDGQKSSSPTDVNKLKSMIYELGFYVAHYSCTQYAIRDALSSEPCVLLVRGHNPDTDSNHMWLCDAVKSYHYKYTWYRNEKPLLTDKWELYKQWQDPIQTLNYYNWGWGPDYREYCGWYADLSYKTHYPSSNGIPIPNTNYCENVEILKIRRR